MKPETPKADAPPRALTYVQFRSPIPVGGDFAQIEYWSVAKHGEKIACSERGNWIHLTYGGQTSRVPMTNVACIREGAP